MDPSRTPRKGPPLPREHGAWMMLYAPLVTGLVAFRVEPLVATLLIGVVTAVFFGQNALGLWLRGRGAAGNLAWLVSFALVGTAAGAALLFHLGLWRLLPLALPALLLFIWQAWQRRATRRQIDHSTTNEAVTASVMALGAAAAGLAAGRAPEAAALAAAAFACYFVGSVLYVKMRVADARSGGASHRSALLCGLYHAAAGVVCLLWAFVASPAEWVCVAAAPAIGRAWIGWARLDGSMPSLRRLGVAELVYATWFSLWMGVALYQL